MCQQEKEKRIEKFVCLLVGACVNQKQFGKKDEDVMMHLCKNVKHTWDVLDLLDNLRCNMQKLMKVNVLDANEMEDPEYDHHNAMTFTRQETSNSGHDRIQQKLSKSFKKDLPSSCTLSKA